MNFTDALTRIDVAVEDHLCDDAAFQVQGQGALIPARVQVNRPMDLERLQGAGFPRARPVLTASVASIPTLRTGDVFTMGRWVAGIFTPGSEVWRMAEAPTRPDDGRWWRGEVEPL